MKKTIITLLFTIGVFCATAQSTQNNIYIIFDPLIPYPSFTEYVGKTGGIYANTANNNYQFVFRKYINNECQYVYYLYNEKSLTIQNKPIAYVEELKSKGQLIDWDEYYRTHTDAEIRAFYMSLKPDQIVYMINRSDRPSAYEYKLVPTRRHIPNQY